MEAEKARYKLSQLARERERGRPGRGAWLGVVEEQVDGGRKTGEKFIVVQE